MLPARRGVLFCEIECHVMAELAQTGMSMLPRASTQFWEFPNIGNLIFWLDRPGALVGACFELHATRLLIWHRQECRCYLKHRDDWN